MRLPKWKAHTGESTSCAFSGNWSAKFSKWGWRKECMRFLWQTGIELDQLSIWENTSVSGPSNQGVGIQERIPLTRTGVRFGEFFKWKVTLQPGFSSGVVLDLLGCESSWVRGGCQDAVEGRDVILGTVPISQQRRGRAWGLQTMQEHFLCSWVTALGCQHSQHSVCGASWAAAPCRKGPVPPDPRF